MAKLVLWEHYNPGCGNNNKSISIEPITILFVDISIPPTSFARNIGVIFDSAFQMDAQTGKVC